MEGYNHIKNEYIARKKKFSKPFLKNISKFTGLGQSDNTPPVVQCTADLTSYITVLSPLHVQVDIICNSFITGYL
jgi:hypothetical protein